MDKLNFNLSEITGKFKPMNAVNNGPIHNWNRPRSSNLELYKATGIPYARNHDAAACSSYGGEHTVDISAIFPDFDADPYLPESYDFACTDLYLKTIEAGGAKCFYRLGQTIEWYVKKYYTKPPKDFKKWAVICEHVIRHYTEGWANGFNYDIEYWEIWNEPDGAEAAAIEDKPTWGGSRELFFNFYEIAATHLKLCFPHLKIGGPSLGCNNEWAEHFLKEMKRRNVPIDFFTWHSYIHNPLELKRRIHVFKDILVRTGYEKAECINAEWNYNEGWLDPQYTNNFKIIHSMKGAAFTMACMTVGQQSPLDMLMYYDARPGNYNGIFNRYLEPLKTYYVMKWYSEFYKTNGEVKSSDEIENIYSLCGCYENGKVVSVITYFNHEQNLPDKEIKIDFGREGNFEIYLLDENHDGELISTTTDLTITIKHNTCIMIKEI